jgi:hypothetical protein
MKKIAITFTEEIVTTQIISVPNQFQFKKSDNPEIPDDDNDFRFEQLEKYFNKTYKPLKLQSNRQYEGLNIHLIEEIKQPDF